MNFTTLCTHLCKTELRTAQLMHDGVAFYNPPTPYIQKAYYCVFSHEGELIDYLTVFEVEGMVKKLKDLGVPIGKCQGVDTQHPGFTLAWEGDALDLMRVA